MAKARGTDQVLKNLQKFRRDLDRHLKTEIGAVARTALRDLKRRLSFPYRTVPSYLTAAEYAAGIEAYFSTQSQPIEEEWRSQAQLKPETEHRLRDLLTVSIKSSNEDVLAEIGYPESVDDPYISAVLYGTPRMQPRPFLDEILKDYEDKFQRAFERAVEKALR